MRLIDADALIEGYKHMGYDPTEHPEESYMEGWCEGFNSAIDHCMHHVIHAPTVGQPELHWIPCSERMPVEGQKCLVCDKGSIGIDTYIGHGNPYNWKWYTRDYEAWLPLPEPYRGGDSNE